MDPVSDRPKKVRTAVTILYATLGIGIIRTILESSATAQMAGSAFMIFVTAVVFAIMWLFIAMIARRKNWARITVLILFLLGLIFAIEPMKQSFSVSALSGVLGMVQLVLQALALVFLFQREASTWFKAGPSRNRRNF